ncbi:Rab-GTPase-TBC domain-containing protein [Hirschfeldia incana]|nr:Rab-GTPase-TBC domain-containing protein [Hirschfeldia incana]
MPSSLSCVAVVAAERRKKKRMDGREEEQEKRDDSISNTQERVFLVQHCSLTSSPDPPQHTISPTSYHLSFSENDAGRNDYLDNPLQLVINLQRTVPDVSFFQKAQVQKSLERILYTWAIRHPANGYVQAINDLVTPFLVIFLSEYLEGGVESWLMSGLSSEKISDVEADCYWCLTTLLDVYGLEPVARHMEEQGLEFLQFAFRWCNCLLIREELRYKLGFVNNVVVRRAEETGLSRDVMFMQDLPRRIYMDRSRAGHGFVKSFHLAQYVQFPKPLGQLSDLFLDFDVDFGKQWFEFPGMVKFAGHLVHRFLLSIICLSSFQDVAAQYKVNESTTSELANPPGIGVSGPIQVSPSVIPKYESPPLPWTQPPMYPTFPDTYEPKLTGKCPADFQAISTVIDTAASDCSQPFAALVGNVICCPQFVSLLHIFQGHHSLKSDKLVLPDAVAADCFSDIVSILVSKRANTTIPELCSVTSSNLTGGSCPVQDVAAFERAVNGSELLDACRAVDPLKECCRPVCQGAVMEAAVVISGHQLNALNDCKNVVFSYISRKLPADKANTAFRILSSCKVNKVCPLELKEPSEVVKACGNVAAPSPSCCNSLNEYISGIRNQMLITNKQAIVCATLIGSMLRKGGVMTNIYELCDVDLKDFSVQAYGMQQGCLLRSYPADLIFDNTTGYSFTCDLTDNIDAPWPSSSSMSSLSLCAPEMSLPALPTSQTHKNHGFRDDAFGALRPVIILLSLLYGVLLDMK